MSKKSVAEEYCEEYVQLIRLNIGPVTEADVRRAFMTGFQTGEVHASLQSAVSDFEDESDT